MTEGRASTAGDEQKEGKLETLKLWFRLLLGVRRERWGEVSGYVFILPGLLLFAVFEVYPMVYGFWMAFTDFRFLVPNYAPFVGVGNFLEFLTDDTDFWPSLRRSLYFTALYVPLMIGSGLFYASIISLVKNPKIAGFYRTIVYLPVILPIAVAVLMWREMFSTSYGFVNHFIANILHMPQWKQPWLSTARWTVPVVALTRIWKDSGFATLLFLIGIYNINRELYEAAALDGASTFRQWWHITIPLLKPTATVVLVMYGSIASAAQEFMIMYQQAYGPEKSALTLGYYIWRVAFRLGNMRMGYAAAMSLFLGFISMLIAGTIFRVLRTERG